MFRKHRVKGIWPFFTLGCILCLSGIALALNEGARPQLAIFFGPGLALIAVGAVMLRRKRPSPPVPASPEAPAIPYEAWIRQQLPPDLPEEAVDRALNLWGAVRGLEFWAFGDRGPDRLIYTASSEEDLKRYLLGQVRRNLEHEMP